MKVTVIGLGYAGLVTSAGFAEYGNDVAGYDIDLAKLDALLAGKLPFYEPGLDDLVTRNVEAGRLVFTSNVGEAVRDADVVFLAVGTPSKEDGSADLSQLFAAVDAIAPHMDLMADKACVAVKSTVPVGTNKRVYTRLCEHVMHRTASRVRLPASVPEFLREGTAVDDVLRPARVVIGIHDHTEGGRAVQERLVRLHRPLVRDEGQILVMDPASAELTKYAANAMLATRISFMNEMALLCDVIGADVRHVQTGIGTDPRIGPQYLHAGCGFGGSCFPKDLRALFHTFRAHGLPGEMVESALDVNRRQIGELYYRIKGHFKAGEEDTRFPLEMRVAIWGLAFKPETDDIRESPALVLADRLSGAGVRVRLHDPVVRRAPDADEPPIMPDPYAAAEGADALVLCTEWRQYRRPDWERLAKIMRQLVVFDGRNIWDPKEAKQHGFTYYGIGRR